MGSPNMEARPSTDSADSNAPLISSNNDNNDNINNPIFRPPPPPDYLRGNAMPASSIRTSRASLNIKVSIIVIVLRILAAIAGLAIGISFILLHVKQDIAIALTVFVWFTLAWDVLLLVRLFATGPSLRVSLVMRDGRAVNLISRDDDEDEYEEDGQGGVRRTKKRRCGWLKRAFWIDLILLVVVLTLNIVCHVFAWGMYDTTVGLNWFGLSFHIFIAVLTASPKLASAHVRFEQSDLRIALP